MCDAQDDILKEWSLIDGPSVMIMVTGLERDARLLGDALTPILAERREKVWSLATVSWNPRRDPESEARDVLNDVRHYLHRGGRDVFLAVVAMPATMALETVCFSSFAARVRSATYAVFFFFFTCRLRAWRMWCAVSLPRKLTRLLLASGCLRTTKTTPFGWATKPFPQAQATLFCPYSAFSQLLYLLHRERRDLLGCVPLLRSFVRSCCAERFYVRSA